MRLDAKWEKPQAAPVSREEFSEMQEFVPVELLKRDKVQAVVKLISEQQSETCEKPDH